MATHPVLDTLDHDRKRHLPGDTVELTEEQAAPLLALGVVGEAAEAQDEPGRPQNQEPAEAPAADTPKPDKAKKAKP